MRRLTAPVKILIGLLVGASLGLIVNVVARERFDWVATNIAEPIGRVFLRLIFMVVVPLVFSALAVAVTGFADARRLGRIGLKTLGFTLILSIIAVVIGITLTNSIRPGAGLDAEHRDALLKQFAPNAETIVDSVIEKRADDKKTNEPQKKTKPIRDILLDIIPENPIQEAVGAMDGSSKGNGMVAVMFFALIFGVALTRVGEERRLAMITWLEAVFDACLAIIGFAMRIAPLAVGCLLFATTSRIGFGIVRSLAWFVLTVLLGLSIHLFIVVPLLLRTFSRFGPIDFFRRISEVIVTALGTSSSNATLPTALRVSRDRLGLPAEISNFVLTVGATGNQNGTALYEGVVVLFLAQVFGVHLSLGQQFFVVGMAILAGIGTAGVPSGSLPMIAILCQAVHVPPEGIGIIVGVDRILDMGRTVLNVGGDMAIAACVASGEPDDTTADSS